MNIDETPKHLISLEAGWFDYAQSLLSEMAFICHVKRLPCVRGVVELGGGLGATYSSLGRNRLGGRLGVGKSIHTVPHSLAIIAYGVYSPRKLKCIPSLVGRQISHRLAWVWARCSGYSAMFVPRDLCT